MEGTLHKDHEDHIAGKGINSLNHYNLVHKLIPLLKAMKIQDAKAAVDKELEKLEKIRAWQLTKVRNKKEVISEARKEGKPVHFSSLVDIWHLKNSELEPQFQKYKGRFVFRGDIVKDDSGSYAVVTEQGWFISVTNDASKSNGCHIKATRMRRTSNRRSISSHSGQN